MKKEFDFRFLGIRLDVNQRKAYFLIGLLIFFSVIIKSLVQNFIHPKKYHFTDDQRQLLERLRARKIDFKEEQEYKIHQKTYQNQSKVETKSNKKWVPFDPNTITKEDLEKLPMPGNVVNNILKYRATGATFKNPDDFRKIYGIAPFFEELKPYLRFNESDSKEKNKFNVDSIDSAIQKDDDYGDDTILFEPIITEENNSPKKVANIIVEINEANIYQLIQIKGVGEWYAKKLVAIRDKIGGFIDKNQIYELSGIPSDRIDVFIESIAVDETKIKKWRINKVLDKEINQHPFFTNKQAKILILYRMHHKGIQNLDQLRDVKVFSEEDIKKLEPYLDFSM